MTNLIDGWLVGWMIGEVKKQKEKVTLENRTVRQSVGWRIGELDKQID